MSKANKKAMLSQRTVRCSVFFTTTNDSSIAIYVHCIKANLNVKLKATT